MTSGCTPSVRRLMASASRPVRLRIIVRVKIDENGSIDACLLRHNMRHAAGDQPYHTFTGGLAWLHGRRLASGNTAKRRQSASKARCVVARREHSNPAGADGL